LFHAGSARSYRLPLLIAQRLKVHGYDLHSRTSDSAERLHDRDHRFTRLWPSLAVVAGYCIAFYSLSLTLRSIQVGVAYAVWSGVGIVLVTVVAWLVHDQKLDVPAVAGIGLIVSGVVVLQLFSKTVTH
jgi:small multidrug resistance pump